MNKDRSDRIAHVEALCREAEAALGSDGPFRLRILLQMALLEAAKERDASDGPAGPPMPDAAALPASRGAP